MSDRPAMRSTVFVIMPVGSDPRFAERRSAIEAAISACGLDAHFPFEDGSHTGFDLPAMLSQLRSSAVVVADLTLERPSCYFEVGVAQTVHPSVVLIAEQGTTIHQVGGAEAVSFYASIDELAGHLAQRLRSSSIGAVRRPAKK